MRMNIWNNRVFKNEYNKKKKKKEKYNRKQTYKNNYNDENVSQKV